MTVSLCLNPKCRKKNPRNTSTCLICGSDLLLGGRYRAVEFLGKGAFGYTFKAIDEHRLFTLCVIKQFMPLHQMNAAVTEKCIQLFQQEALRLCELGKHPQIPDLLAFIQQDGNLCLVQEFVDGLDLFKEVKFKGKFSEAEVKQVLSGLLPILQFVHENHVIHGDIKPSNILRRTKDGVLLLIDFGVAKQLSTDFTKNSSVSGTMGYAAPEQMRGVLFPSSDLYCLGTTCIRLLTGAFIKSDGVDPLFNQNSQKWLWRDFGVSVSKKLEHILDKLLQEIPGNRYQSANEVLEALNAREMDDTIYMGPRSMTEPVTSRGKKARTIVPLNSDVGADYTKLRDLLEAKKYEEANKETFRLMFKITERDKEGWLRPRDVENFPCTDLNTINQLWIENSIKRFGFSVQNNIYKMYDSVEVPKKKSWLDFCDHVGWRVEEKWLTYRNINFDMSATPGHLPVPPPNELGQSMIGSNASFVSQELIQALMYRIAQCNF